MSTNIVFVENTAAQIKEFLRQYHMTVGRVQECNDVIATLEMRQSKHELSTENAADRVAECREQLSMWAMRRDSHKRGLVMMRSVFEEILEQQSEACVGWELSVVLREIRGIVEVA